MYNNKFQSWNSSVGKNNEFITHRSWVRTPLPAFTLYKMKVILFLFLSIFLVIFYFIISLDNKSIYKYRDKFFILSMILFLVSIIMLFIYNLNNINSNILVKLE